MKKNSNKQKQRFHPLFIILLFVCAAMISAAPYIRENLKVYAQEEELQTEEAPLPEEEPQNYEAASIDEYLSVDEILPTNEAPPAEETLPAEEVPPADETLPATYTSPQEEAPLPNEILEEDELLDELPPEEELPAFFSMRGASRAASTDTMPDSAYSLTYLLNHYQAVAFGDHSLGQHCLGPVLVQGDFKPYGGRSGSGYADSAYVDAPSYIGGYVSFTGGANSRQQQQTQQPLYVGTSNTITANNTLNGLTGTNYVTGIYLTDNYIDWNRLYSSVRSTSLLLASASSGNVQTADNWGTIQVAAGSNTSVQTDNKYLFVNIVGDATGKTTIVNVIDSGTVIAPKFKYNGVDFTTSEDHRDAPPIALNFPNASKVNVPSAMTPAFGHLIAPQADIEIPTGNYNGCLVGQNVIIDNAEGHLWPFRGTFQLTQIQFALSKTVNGQAPDASQTFSFHLAELIGMQWNILETVHNNGENISFSEIEYLSGGDHWYLMYEEQAQGPGSPYLLSKTLYAAHVVVEVIDSGTGTAASLTASYYRVNDNVTPEQLIASGTVDTALLTLIPSAGSDPPQSSMVFHNQTLLQMPETGSFALPLLWLCGLTAFLIGMSLLTLYCSRRKRAQ